MDNKIKNLMFDLGGVIMKIKRDNAVEALKAIGLADADSLLGVYGQKGVFLQLERGEITPQQFRDALRQQIPHPVTDEQIDRAFGKFLIGIPVERLRQLEALKAAYNLYLLSNTNAIMWHEIILDSFKSDGHDMGYYFKDYVASFEVNAYKPEARIFNIAAERFGINPAETIFFDDSSENVEAAINLGFKGVHVADERPFDEYLN